MLASASNRRLRAICALRCIQSSVFLAVGPSGMREGPLESRSATNVGGVIGANGADGASERGRNEPTSRYIAVDRAPSPGHVGRDATGIREGKGRGGRGRRGSPGRRDGTRCQVAMPPSWNRPVPDHPPPESDGPDEHHHQDYLRDAHPKERAPSRVAAQELQHEPQRRVEEDEPGQKPRARRPRRQGPSRARCPRRRQSPVPQPVRLHGRRPPHRPAPNRGPAPPPQRPHPREPRTASIGACYAVSRAVRPVCCAACPSGYAARPAARPRCLPRPPPRPWSVALSASPPTAGT